jgi:hypothetical protein
MALIQFPLAIGDGWLTMRLRSNFSDTVTRRSSRPAAMPETTASKPPHAGPDAGSNECR